MDWLKANWKLVAKYAGLGAGCVAVAVAAFVGARWIAAGNEYEGELTDLAPAQAAIVIRVDNVPRRKYEIERLLEHALMQPGLGQFESSTLFKDSLGDSLDGGLYQFKQEKWDTGLERAKRDVNQLGAVLFEDILGGELVLCSDPGEGATEFIALSRVSRAVRFRWQFIDLASGFFPDEPGQPRLEYAAGVLTITPPATPENPTPTPTMIALLDDVLAVSNSTRLLNESIRLHTTAGKGMSARADYTRALALAPAERREKHVAGIWLDLDRLRKRLPPKADAGVEVSPIDRFDSLPKSVEGIYPDIFMPVNRILKADLDSRPFHVAYYGLDISEPGVLMFDQYLVAEPGRIARPEYEYLRKTWAQPAAKATHIEILPQDTMLVASYRQPLEVLYNDVFDQRARESLVGDFIVALRAPGVKAQLPNEISELAFAAAPRSYAPDASIPLGGTEFPLPAFALMFRSAGANPQAARALLEEYLNAQRGRKSEENDDTDEDEAPNPNRVVVVEKTVGGFTAYGFHDPREEDNFIRRLNRTIRAAVVGEWLVMTNSEDLLAHALASREGGLAKAPGSVWRLLPDAGSATVYLGFDQFAAYAGGPELSKVLRDNKYNTGLIEGRDPGEVRREIAAEVGTTDLSHAEVARRFNERKSAWLRECMVEGNRYEAELRADMAGMRFFRDLALITRFHGDHLHVQGVLRIGR
ncbi:MAG: hypothetical protein KF696_09535 [Planctomycetes bacterium]|nr:hypothetical protein [Planctomycetota bacterium]MCW8136099.1 hypothetical protein [Planctomycetota bacterium]